MKVNKKIEEDLFKLADKKYLEFNKKIVNDDSLKYMGVKTPLIREYAKKMKNEYELQYLLDNIEEQYYEEILLKGFLIGEYKKISYEELEKYIKYYVPKITNWSLCDLFCCSIKVTKKYLSSVWDLIQNYLKSNKEFEVRFALVMILDYFLNDEYIDKVYSIINNVKLEDYYVKMANAWLISYCFIKYYDKTYKFYKNDCKIDTWTYNKGIQKSIESYRITDKQKDQLRKIKKLTK